VKLRFIALVLICLFALVGARPALRGNPIGKVVDVDKRARTVLVDLGARDGVLKGLKFSIVGRRGSQVALVVAKDVREDSFWSETLPTDDMDGIFDGMEVRWVLTPETSMLIGSRRKNTAGAYRDFIRYFPGSAFLPELVRGMPEPMLKDVDPEFYTAWKAYTREAFGDYIKRHPGSGLAMLAEAEIKSLGAYDAEQEKIRQERAKRADAYDAEQKRREAVEDKAKSLNDMAGRKEMMGKLVNNSNRAVRFVFQQPSDLPPETVQANSSMDVRHPSGSYAYKVFSIDENPSTALPGAEPAPLASGNVDIVFDFWEVAYP